MKHLSLSISISLLTSLMLAACAQNSEIPPVAGQPPNGSNAAPGDASTVRQRVALRNVALGYAIGSYASETDYEPQNLLVNEISDEAIWTGKAWVFGKFTLANHVGLCKAVDANKFITTTDCAPGDHSQEFAFIPTTTGAVQLYSVSENRCVNASSETEGRARFGVVDCVADLKNPLKEVPAIQLWQITPELGNNQALLQAPF